MRSQVLYRAVQEHYCNLYDFSPGKPSVALTTQALLVLHFHAVFRMNAKYQGKLPDPAVWFSNVACVFSD